MNTMKEFYIKGLFDALEKKLNTSYSEFNTNYAFIEINGDDVEGIDLGIMLTLDSDMSFQLVAALDGDYELGEEEIYAINKIMKEDGGRAHGLDSNWVKELVRGNLRGELSKDVPAITAGVQKIQKVMSDLLRKALR